MATRIVEHELLNNQSSQNKVWDAVDKVNSAQHVATVAAYLNTLLSIAGIFKASLGIAATNFGGIMNFVGDFYENLEDFYTGVARMMSSNEIGDGTPTSEYIYSVTIKYKFTETTQGEKLNGVPTVVYHWKKKNAAITG